MITNWFLLFVIFLVLRLTHVIDWSWWYVVSPLLVDILVKNTYFISSRED